MANYKLVVLTNPVEGKEEAYNDWYTNQHLGDVLRCDGFVSAQRFKLADETPGAHRYLAIYEMDTDNLKATMDGLEAAAGTDKMPMTDAMVMEDIVAVAYSAITDVVR